MMRKISVTLIGLFCAIAPDAIAQSMLINSDSISIVFEGIPNTPFEANIWTPKTTTKTANRCGLVIFYIHNHPMQSVKIDNKTIDWRSLPMQTIPTCKDGELSEPREVNFRTSDNQTVIVNQAAVTAQYLLKRNRIGNFNACGFKISTIGNYTESYADIQIEFNGKFTTIADLKLLWDLPVCPN